MTNLTLPLDTMRGDNGPGIIVPAALQALVSNPQLRLLLFGIPEILNPLLADQRAELRDRLQIIPAEYASVVY